MRDHILSALILPIRSIIGLLIYRKVGQTLWGQGTGRLSTSEIAALRIEVWESLNVLLTDSKRMRREEETGEKGEKGVFWVLGGKEPTEADAVVFGFVVSVLVCTACPESREVVRGFPVLVEYAERIHERYFPDYERW
jgi:hypothetical protein